MLLEATIALFGLMGFTWAAAIWASYQEPRYKQDTSLGFKLPARKAA